MKTAKRGEMMFDVTTIEGEPVRQVLVAAPMGRFDSAYVMEGACDAANVPGGGVRAWSLEADGMEVSLGSYEDGLFPDGCCVTGRVGQDSVKLDLAKNGRTYAVSYRVRIEDTREVDAGSVSASLAGLAASVGRAGVEIGLDADQLPVDARKVEKGMRRGSVDSERVKVGGTKLERIYRYEDFKGYGVLEVTVKEPPADVSGSKPEKKASKKAKRKKTAVWAHPGALQGYIDRHRRYL